ncbi:MAG: hypothetical protein BZ138_05870 [Methanosphaera sp. rholeuAM270]|nr:MAG: hypothetical protein BZ138_05870 [Methanosphaera sp. rholeuAM270]
MKLRELEKYKNDNNVWFIIRFRYHGNPVGEQRYYKRFRDLLDFVEDNELLFEYVSFDIEEEGLL